MTQLAPDAAGFVYASTELDAMADARNYYGAILDRFLPHLGNRVVEVGAGIGTFAAMLLDRTRPESLTLIEPAGNNYPALERRFAHDPHVTTRHGYLEQFVPELSADSVIMVNVAEHAADDLALVREARAALVPGGALLLFVPALPWLFGTLDEAFEHHRRYTLRSLRMLLEQAELRPVVAHYANFAGVLPWFVAGRVLRRRTLTRSSVRTYDQLVTPWVSRLERRWQPPFGQSILAIARR